MTQQLSTSVIGYILLLKNGNEYKLGIDTGEKLEQLLCSDNLPKFVRIKCDGDVATVSVSMIAELKRDTQKVTYKADW